MDNGKQYGFCGSFAGVVIARYMAKLDGGIFGHRRIVEFLVEALSTIPNIGPMKWHIRVGRDKAAGT